MSAETIPLGLCQCGCGARTRLIGCSDSTRGRVKGQPYRYVKNHNGKPKLRHGYVVVRVNGDWRHQHRLVAERAIGKPLPSQAEVHHVNGDKRDNRPSNLVICENLAYHKLLHYRAKVLKAGGDPNTQRLCARCRTLKLTTDFYQCATARFPHCKACVRETNARRYAKDGERYAR